MVIYKFKHSRHTGRPLADYEILKLCVDRLMISPYLPEKVRQVDGKPVISYGLSSFGYDIRLGRKIAFFDTLEIDPKNPPKVLHVEYTPEAHEGVAVPPHTLVLGESVECFNMPPDVVGLGFGKSTYARCGLLVGITPLEPNWRGILTIALTNPTNNSIRVYPFEGIAQIVFFKGSLPKAVYDGPYQGQTGVTLPRVGRANKTV